MGGGAHACRCARRARCGRSSAGGSGRYAPSGDAPLRDVLAAHPFHLLAEDGMVSVSGLGGKLWSLGDTFVRFDGAGGVPGVGASPGYCKVVVRHEVRAARRRRRRRSRPTVRIWCTDRRAQLRFRPYWAFIGPFSRFIGSELLSAATRRAERTSLGAPPERRAR